MSQRSLLQERPAKNACCWSQLRSSLPPVNVSSAFDNEYPAHQPKRSDGSYLSETSTPLIRACSGVIRTRSGANSRLTAKGSNKFSNRGRRRSSDLRNASARTEYRSSKVMLDPGNQVIGSLSWPVAVDAVLNL